LNKLSSNKYNVFYLPWNVNCLSVLMKKSKVIEIKTPERNTPVKISPFGRVPKLIIIIFIYSEWNWKLIIEAEKSLTDFNYAAVKNNYKIDCYN